MFPALLVGMEGWCSERSTLTWHLRATKLPRLLCFRLQASEHPTDGTGFGLSLTPTTVQRNERPEDMRARAHQRKYKNGTKYNTLLSQVLYGNTGFAPTPRAADGMFKALRNPENIPNGNGRGRLEDIVALGLKELVPTPAATDYKGTSPKHRHERTLIDLARRPTGKTIYLHPSFVEWMMGYPIGHSELKPSATRSSRS